MNAKTNIYTYQKLAILLKTRVLINSKFKCFIIAVV